MHPVVVQRAEPLQIVHVVADFQALEGPEHSGFAPLMAEERPLKVTSNILGAYSALSRRWKLNNLRRAIAVIGGKDESYDSTPERVDWKMLGFRPV